MLLYSCFLQLLCRTGLRAFFRGWQVSRLGQLKPPAEPDRSFRLMDHRDIFDSLQMVCGQYDYGSLLEMLLPGGVIGNTRGFDPRIPGSSPGRVSFASKIMGK